MYLNRVYDALVAIVDQHGGSILGFAGDAITCWFGGKASALQATACGFALLEAMPGVGRIEMPEGDPLLLGLKVAITSGMTRRFLVGDPAIQVVDTLAGAVVARVAAGEELALRGELLADALTIERLADAVRVREWRESEANRFAVLDQLVAPVQQPPTAFPDTVPLIDESVSSPLLPAFARELPNGLDTFQIELRPVTALFLRFAGIDYDHDPDAQAKLDQLIRLVQRAVADYEGNMLQLTIGDKGSYLYAVFGAPYAHEDDPARALSAAMDIQQQTGQFADLPPVQIGISRGIARTGIYGGTTRRTYGALGDEVNLAARLMQQAEPGTILISESLLGARLEAFALQRLAPVQIKGKAQPILTFRVIGRNDRSFEERFYTTPMIGRDDLVAQVTEALRPLFEGRHAGVIYLYGEAGMGKSRLAFEIQQRIQAQTNVTWLVGQAEQLNGTPLSAFAYFLRPSFGQRRELDAAANQAAFDAVFDRLLALADDSTRADLLHYRSYLAGAVGVVIPGSAFETADAKLRTDNEIVAIKAWARAESRRRPVVIQLEDANWLDPISIQAVQQLTYGLDDRPLVLLLTSRYNDDGTPFVIPNIYNVPVQSFDLNRLSEEGIRVVADTVLHGAISDGLAHFVSERVEGNPFFAEQIVLDLKERDGLVEIDGVWEIRPDTAAEVPSNVNAVLIARLDRLTAQVKEVVQTAAVLGREFEVTVLSRMLRETNMPAILEAEREAIWSALDDLRYLFRHALLRDAAYQMQAQERLKVLHRIAAETMESLHPDDVSQYDALLEHWHIAGELDREIHYLEPVAARMVEITGQYGQAELLLERALAALAEDDIRREALLKWLSQSCWRRGDLLLSLDIASEWQRLAERFGDRSGVAQSLRQSGITKRALGATEEARAYHVQALAIFRELDDQRGIALTLNNLGAVAMQQGHYDEARSPLEESLAISRALSDPINTPLCLANLGTVHLMNGGTARAQASFEEALVIWRETGNRAGIFIGLSKLGIIKEQQKAFGEARAYHEQCLAIAHEIGDRMRIVDALQNLETVAREEGDYSATRRYLEQSLAIAREIGYSRAMVRALSNLGMFAFSDRDYALAEDLHRQALSIRRESRDAHLYFNLGSLALILLRLGQIDEARSMVREALNVVHNSKIFGDKLFIVVSVSDLYRSMARPEQAVELLSLALNHPRSDSDVRSSAAPVLEELRSQLDPLAFDAALERGKTLDLVHELERLVAEFG